MRKHARVIPLLAIVAAPLALVAGGCEGPEATELSERSESSSEAIVAGTIDTTNQAVVAILIDNGACTGTIIAKNGSTGYVLTAGHCQSSNYYILQADDYEDCINGNELDPSLPGCDAVYVANDDLLHPQYDDNYEGQGFPAYDFLLLRFSGATASTPVMPADDGSANLAPGNQVEISGYGVINSGGQLVSNSQRRHVFNNVENLYEPPMIEFSQNWTNDGGACSGDSGGPAIKNGKVVGVTSWGDQYCQEIGFSAWVEPVYPWIAAYIGAEVPDQTCDECVQGWISAQCSATFDACTSDAQCSGLLECFNGCTTNACYDDCASTYPGGIDGYNAIVTCAYCDACDSICQESFCDDPGSSVTSGSGPTGAGVTSGAGVTTGTGGDTVTGATTGTGDPLGGGGAPGSGGGSSSDDDDDDGNGDDGGDDGDNASGEGSSCSVGAAGAPAGGAARWAVAAAALALGVSRRRRS